MRTSYEIESLRFNNLDSTVELSVKVREAQFSFSSSILMDMINLNLIINQLQKNNPEVYKSLAYEICLNEQMACSSPQTVFVEDTSFEDLKKVAEELGEDMTDEELREMLTGANKGGKDGIVDIN